MRKLLNKVLGVFQWIWKRPETQELLTAVQAKILADGKEIAQIAIAEVISGNFTSNDEKRKAAIGRIKNYLISRGKQYPDWAYNWLLEHVYARFANNVTVKYERFLRRNW